MKSFCFVCFTKNVSCFDSFQKTLAIAEEHETRRTIIERNCIVIITGKMCAMKNVQLIAVRFERNGKTSAYVLRILLLNAVRSFFFCFETRYFCESFAITVSSVRPRWILWMNDFRARFPENACYGPGQTFNNYTMVEKRSDFTARVCCAGLVQRNIVVTNKKNLRFRLCSRSATAIIKNDKCSFSFRNATVLRIKN